METPESEVQEKSNGVSAPVADVMSDSVKKVKPWIDAGFTSRDAWRASKGQKTGKTKKVNTAGMSPAAARTVSRAAAAAAANAEPKPKTKKKIKKPAKVKVKAAAKVVKKHKKAKLAKKLGKKLTAKTAKKAKDKKIEKKGPAVKDNSLPPVAVAELSTRCKKVFLAVGKGKTATIEEIQKKACPSLSHAKGNSLVRNQLRFLRVHRMFKKLGDGQYKRIA